MSTDEGLSVGYSRIGEKVQNKCMFWLESCLFLWEEWWRRTICIWYSYYADLRIMKKGWENPLCAVWAESAGVRMHNFRSGLTWQCRLPEYHHLHFHLILNSDDSQLPILNGWCRGHSSTASRVSININKTCRYLLAFHYSNLRREKSKLQLNEYAEWGRTVHSFPFSGNVIFWDSQIGELWAVIRGRGNRNITGDREGSTSGGQTVWSHLLLDCYSTPYLILDASHFPISLEMWSHPPPYRRVSCLLAHLTNSVLIRESLWIILKSSNQFLISCSLSKIQPKCDWTISSEYFNVGLICFHFYPLPFWMPFKTHKI